MFTFNASATIKNAFIKYSSSSFLDTIDIAVDDCKVKYNILAITPHNNAESSRASDILPHKTRKNLINPYILNTGSPERRE